MSLWNFRLRALLQRQFAVVVAALVVLALVGGVATYTAYVDPGTTTEERVVSTWETTGQFDHSATVTEENPVFPVGDQLQDRSVYFARLSPVLNGSYVFGYRTTGDGELTAEIDLALVTRSTASDETGSGSEILWETRRRLGETRTATLGSDERVRVPFSLNTTAVTDRQSRIAEQLGTSGGTVETAVVATVNVTGTVNDERIVDTRSHTLPLTFESDVYRVGAIEEPTERIEITQPVAVPREYGPLRTVGGPLLVGLSVVGLAGLTVARSRDDLGLTDAEREWLAYREDRSEFDEWITEFTVPQEAFDRPRARAASLGDLVDFAIDTDSGVVESADGHQYLVVHDEFLYTYTAPREPEPDGRSGTESDGSDEFTSDAWADDGSTGDTDADAGSSRLDVAALDLGLGASAEDDENETEDAADGGSDEDGTARSGDSKPDSG